MGYGWAGELLSDATVVLDNQALQKVAHHAPHREASDYKGYSLRKDLAQFLYYLFLGVTQLRAQMPMPIATEYYRPDKRHHGIGRYGTYHFIQTREHGASGNKYDYATGYHKTREGQDSREAHGGGGGVGTDE